MTIFKDKGYIPPVNVRDNLPLPIDTSNPKPEDRPIKKVAVAGRTDLASGLVEDNGNSKVEDTAKAVISVVGPGKATASNSN